MTDMLSGHDNETIAPSGVEILLHELPVNWKAILAIGFFMVLAGYFWVRQPGPGVSSAAVLAGIRLVVAGYAGGHRTVD